MSIAHQAEVLGLANSAAGNYDTSITPAAAPNGVVVIVTDDTSISDVVTSVTYGVSTGAVPLLRRRVNTESTEPGAVYVYWAGGMVFPAGAQTVRVARTGADNLRAYIATMTCAAGMQVAVDTDASGTSASVANPSWSMVTSDPTTACYLGIHSGLTTMTATPATNWTLGGSEDIGAQGRGWARRAVTSAGETSPGWTAATADDFVGASIAFREAPLSPTPPPIWQQRSPRPTEQGQVVGPYAPVTPSMILRG